jgi:hypothetical protein
MAINNDSEFKSALNNLSNAKRRLIALRFAENVLALSNDARLRTAIYATNRENIGDEELDAAHQAVKAARVDSYTRCGSECDWGNQSGHFVAEAVLACVKPPEPGRNQAWDAAMHARMARTCEGIANGKGTDNPEANAQYRILTEFLKA